MLSIQTESPIIYVGYNEDASCCSCGTETGFYVYNTKPFKERFHREFGGGVKIVEPYRKTNVVLLVGGGRKPHFPPNRVVVWNDYQNQSMAELDFSSEVLSVKCRNNRILVVLKKECILYNFTNLEELARYDTQYNPEGLAALSEHVLAIPGDSVGKVRFERLDIRLSKVTEAHKNNLSKICLSHDGEWAATTSVRGTLLRIWNTKTGTLIREFRRGLEPTKILSISFSNDRQKIALTSEKGTIHIYSLVPRQHADINQKNRKSLLSFAKKYVPLPDYFSSEWSLQTAILPENQSGLGRIDPENENVLMMLTQRGELHKIDLITTTTALI